MPTATRKIALTDRSLQAMKPSSDGRRSIVWDAIIPGMAVRVSGKGKRVFYAVRRRAGAAQPTWVALGTYPQMTLAEARSGAREALGALIAGEDPAQIAEAKRRANYEAEARRQANSFGAVAEEFIKRHAMIRRSGGETAAIIRRELVPEWGDRHVADITRRDVIRLVEAILDRGGAKPPPGTRRKAGGPYAARHALSVARKLFNWALGRDLIRVSPRSDQGGRTARRPGDARPRARRR
jgi:hypothetical protein